MGYKYYTVLTAYNHAHYLASVTKIGRWRNTSSLTLNIWTQINKLHHMAKLLVTADGGDQTPKLSTFMPLVVAIGN